MKFDQDLPRHTQITIKNYLINGWEPGGFVTSMLALDMERALRTADVANRHYFWKIGRWILDNAPEGSWGNYDLVDAWCKDIDGRRTKWAVWYELNKTEEMEMDADEPPF